jgi:hypothetical protein
MYNSREHSSTLGYTVLYITGPGVRGDRRPLQRTAETAWVPVASNQPGSLCSQSPRTSARLLWSLLWPALSGTETHGSLCVTVSCVGMLHVFLLKQRLL